MTQEEKDLLLKALCTMLPYRIKCKASHGLGNTDKKHEYIGVLKFVGNCYGVIANYYEDVPHDTGLINNVFYDIEYIKPYLRPMSSMTEEEKEELKGKCLHTETEEDWEGTRSDVWGIEILSKYDTRRWDNTIWVSTINMDAIDWLNAHHFDYRGLIPMGLALEAPEDMYN